MTPSAIITAVGFSQLNYYPKRQDTLHQKVSQNTLQNFEVSHPIAFSRAYLLTTCFCVFSFIFPKLLYCRPSALQLMWCGFEPHIKRALFTLEGIEPIGKTQMFLIHMPVSCPSVAYPFAYTSIVGVPRLAQIQGLEP